MMKGNHEPRDAKYQENGLHQALINPPNPSPFWMDTSAKLSTLVVFLQFSFPFIKPHLKIILYLLN